MDGIIKNQEEMMSRIVRLEKSQIQALRPPFKGQERESILQTKE
jgi:hypothetical protein